MMGVGINKVEKVVRAILTNFTNMDIECLQKQRFQDLCTQNHKDLVNSKWLKTFQKMMIVIAEPYIPMTYQNLVKIWNV